MRHLSLPYFNSTRPLSLPDDWLGEMVEPQPVSTVDGAAALIAAALHHPIGTPRLAKLVRPDQTVAIIVDDYTRKTPVGLMLPLVLDELYARGVPHDHIRIVVALGTHRPMTDAEIAQKIGAAIVQAHDIVNVPSTDDQEMVYLGTSSNRIPAYVNRVVAEADVRIGLGMITPHLDAGFSGGMKIVLPGVCSARTVDAFHAQSAFVLENQLGNVAAPLRRALEQFVSERVPLTFIVNVIVTPDEQVYQCVAGDPLQAHRAGVEHALAVFSASAQRRYPIVVANCYPYDIDLWQSVKGIWAGDLLTADGGILIAVTAAPEGNSTYPLVPAYVGRDPEVVKREIEASTAEDAKQAATGVMFRRMMRRIRLALVSDGLTLDDAGTMGIDYYPSVEAAVAAAIDRLPVDVRRGAVGILPHAGMVLPVIDQIVTRKEDDQSDDQSLNARVSFVVS